MGVFNNQNPVFNQITPGKNPNTHIYHEPAFQMAPQKEVHSIFKILGIFAILLFCVALAALDYKSIIFIGKITYISTKYIHLDFK